MALAATLGFGCSESCGDGVEPDAGVITDQGCVSCDEDAGDIATDTGLGDGDLGPADGDSVDLGEPPVDAGPADAGLAELVPAQRPPDLPPPPAIVDVVSITLQTADADFAGTGDPTQVCIDGACVTMDHDGEDLALSAWRTHVQHAAGLNIDRLTATELRLVSGGENQYEPACIDIRFDGRPVHCSQLVDVFLSTDPNDQNGRPSYATPLANDCISCAGSPITHGPALGFPGADSITVWLRGDATRLYGLQLAYDEAGTGATTVAYNYAMLEQDFTVRFDVDGLRPNTTYYYRITVDDVPQGSFRPVRTAPEADDTVRLAFGSCSRTGTSDDRREQQKSFENLIARNLDAFLLVGDSHYGNAQTLSQHRDFIRDTLRIRSRNELFTRVPLAATWDDHDFLGNNTDGECAGRNLALQAVQEYWPNPEFGLPSAPGTYFRHRLGAAELFVLDCRSYRPRLANPNGTDRDPGRRCENSGQTITDLGGGPLGTPQFEWLKASLADSTAPFKLIACGSLVTSNGIDSWNSFPAAREELFSSIHEAGIDGVVFLSGDIHRSHARVMRRTDGYDFYEFVSSPLAQYARATDTRTQCEGALGMTSNGAEALYCDAYNSFVELRVRDDEITAVYFDEEGVQRYAVSLTLEELTTP